MCALCVVCVLCVCYMCPMCCFVLSMSCVCGNQRFCISHFAASAFPVKSEASSCEKEEEGGKQVGEWGMLEGTPKRGKGRAGQEPLRWPWGVSVHRPQHQGDSSRPHHVANWACNLKFFQIQNQAGWADRSCLLQDTCLLLSLPGGRDGGEVAMAEGSLGYSFPG